MAEHPILVTGATGKSGCRVVSRLRAARHPARAAARSGEHPFDWTDASTWDAALEGVRAAYVVQLDGTHLVRPFVDQARKHGVQRIVLASGRGIDDPGYVRDRAGMRDGIADSEAAVRESGLEWTSSRPGWFAQNFTDGFFADAIAAGELRLPAGDGAATFVDAEDIAAVVTASLTEDGHAGQIYELSGSRAVSLAEAVATIPAVTGREIRYVPLSTEDYIAELVGQGVPRAEAEIFADVIEPLREGRDAHVSDGVQRALGRPPRSFAEFAETAVWPGNPVDQAGTVGSRE